MINLTAVIENDEAIRKLKELKGAAKDATSSIVTDADRSEAAFRKLGTALGSIGFGITFKEIASNMAMIRGQFQQLEIAFTTMLGSKEKADKLMADTVKLAATTPFDLQGVASGAKQLLAYGSNVEDVIGEMKMLGDIAAGLSIPLGDLVYLYGTTRTQGRMFTMDLRQFMGRGIPLAEELAKQFGVTKNEVSGLVTAGKVGFEDMRKALVSLTSEGGMFHNLMEEQSKSITGQLSNLEDSIQQMWNNLGKSQEGTISTAISGVSYLVENYEKVGKILMDIAVAYGAYKAAVLAVIAVQKIEKAITEQMIVEKGLLAGANHALSESALRYAATQKIVQRNIMAVKTTLKGFGKLLINPYVLAGAAIAGLIYGTYKLITAKSAEELAQDRVNKKLDEYNEKQSEARTEAESALSVMKNESSTSLERVKAYDALIKAYPELLDKYDKEKIKLMDILDLKKELNEIDSNRTKTNINDEIARIDAEIKRNEDLISATKKAGSSGTSTSDLAFIAQYRRTIDVLKSERAIYLGQLREQTRQEQEAAFDALPKKEKLKQINDQLEATNTALENLGKTGKKYEGMSFGTDLSSLSDTGERERLERKKKELQSKKEAVEKEGTITPTTPTKDELKEQKRIDDERKKAQEEADRAELARLAAHTEDKVALLEAQKQAELKKIDERIKETTDKETIAALNRTKTATEQKYDADIRKVRLEAVKEAEKVEYEARRAGIEDELELLRMEKSMVLAELQDQIDKTTDVETKAALERKKQATELVYNAQENAYYKELLEETATYEEKRNKLIEDYQRKRKQLIEKGEMDNVAVLDKQHSADLLDLDFKELGTYKTIFRDASRLSRQELQKSLDLAEKALETMTDPEKVKVLSDQIKALRAELESSLTKGFAVGLDAIANGYERLKLAKASYDDVAGKGGEAEENAKAELEDARGDFIDSLAGTAINTFVSGLSKAAILMAEIAEESGNIHLKEQSDMLMAATESFGNIFQGFAQGGIAGGIGSIFTVLVNGITDVFYGIEIADERINSFYDDFEKRLELLKLRLTDDVYDAIFGTNSVLKAKDAYRTAQEALSEYNEYLSETAKLTAGRWHHDPWGRDIERNDYLQQMDAIRKGYSMLQGLSVNMTHRSGFAKLFGAQDEFMSLADYAPQIFNDDGSLNIDAAKEFLSIDKNLTDEQKQQVQHAIDLNAAYNEAKETLESIATDIMGEMASSMSDAIFDAVDNGANAWDDFEMSAGKAVKNIAKMMLESWIVEKYLSGFEDAFTTALGSGDANAMTAVIGDIVNGFSDIYKYGQEMVNEIYKSAEEKGIDMSDVGDNKQSATARGFNAMSQDTGDELNGRFTDIQGKVTDIKDMMAQLGATSTLSYNEIVNIRDIMIQLNGNVDQIKVYTKVLPDMLASMNSMNRKLENL